MKKNRMIKYLTFAKAKITADEVNVPDKGTRIVIVNVDENKAEMYSLFTKMYTDKRTILS